MKTVKNRFFFITVAITFLVGLFYFYQSSFVKTTYSFYHWTSPYEVNATQKHPPYYVKVLDISFNETLVFRKTSFKTTPTKSIVPVIYLDNPLWSKMKAKTMVSKVLTALQKMPIKYNEIQVDCDWTDSTRASYFEFLKLLKQQSAKKLSVTIRLHQVKYYSKTGVPPVDYGVLMYYNMSNFKDLETKNYILDLDIAKRYHYNFDSYPLALNLALPLYSQATIIRFSQVVGIMEGVRENALSTNFKKIKEHHYKILKTHYFRGRLLYEGDIIRVDEVTKELLAETITELKKVMKEPKEVVFYRWGNRTFYGQSFLDKLIKGW